MKTAKGDVYVNMAHFNTNNERNSYCPLCNYDLKQVKMIWDEKNKIYRCPNCKYDMPKHQNPIEHGVLHAGNEVNFEKPYMKSVKFSRPTRNMENDDRIYRNAIDAWKS